LYLKYYSILVDLLLKYVETERDLNYQEDVYVVLDSMSWTNYPISLVYFGERFDTCHEPIVTGILENETHETTVLRWFLANMRLISIK